MPPLGLDDLRSFSKLPRLTAIPRLMLSLSSRRLVLAIAALIGHMRPPRICRTRTNVDATSIVESDPLILRSRAYARSMLIHLRLEPREHPLKPLFEGKW